MSSNRYRQKKRRNRFHLVLAIFVSTLLFLILLLILILIIMSGGRSDSEGPQTASPLPSVSTDETETEQPEDEPQTEAQTDEIFSPDRLTQEQVYTFLQGPKAWGAKVDWSGSWCEKVLADQEFSVFGCGLCDLANIYGTLTPFDCSPLDMFYYAQEASGYTPVSGFGAIDWPYLKQTLQTVGITSRLRRKDKSYENFQKAIAGSITSIVLVCSDNDDTYWQGVEGHYVNLWLYDAADDTVFLADSGNPDHNRQRISLRYIYDALKTSSSYQYLLVTEIDEEGNTWQHDGINIAWKKPKYYKTSAAS